MQNLNWFKTGIYTKQLTTIAACVLILCLGQLSSCVNNLFDKAYGSQAKEPLIKSSQSSVYQLHDEDEGGISFKAPDGKTIMMPKEMRGDEKIVGTYRDSTLKLYIDDEPVSYVREDYRVKLSNNFIEVWSIKENRLVGTLTYRTSLGRMILKDNE